MSPEKDFTMELENNSFTTNRFSDTINIKNTPRFSKYNAYYASIGFISFNLFYERNLFELDKAYINYRFGYGYWSDWGGSGNNLYANWEYILGKNNVHLEIGVGLWYIIDDCCSGPWFMDSDNIYSSDLYPLINFGFRYEKPGGGFIFRLGGGSESVINFGLGYSFSKPISQKPLY